MSEKYVANFRVQILSSVIEEFSGHLWGGLMGSLPVLEYTRSAGLIPIIATSIGNKRLI
jgi:hypothetical protein